MRTHAYIAQIDERCSRLSLSNSSYRWRSSTHWHFRRVPLVGIPRLCPRCRGFVSRAHVSRTYKRTLCPSTPVCRLLALARHSISRYHLVSNLARYTRSRFYSPIGIPVSSRGTRFHFPSIVVVVVVVVDVVVVFRFQVEARRDIFTFFPRN